MVSYPFLFYNNNWAKQEHNIDETFSNFSKFNSNDLSLMQLYIKFFAKKQYLYIF